MKKYLPALLSVVLASLAQLLMKWGMSALPALPPDFSFQPGAVLDFFFTAFAAAPWAVASIAAGICCYALSLLCWLIALKALPLGKAYPLLSLSYILVFLAAISLPGFHENFSPIKGAGLVCIVIGVYLASGRGSAFSPPPLTKRRRRDRQKPVIERGD